MVRCRPVRRSPATRPGYEWQRRPSRWYSPLAWKLYKPAIGKFRPALRSMGTIVGDFIKQRPAQPQSEFDLPEYAASGDLILRRTFNASIVVGSPLAPNALKRHPWLSR